MNAFALCHRQFADVEEVSQASLPTRFGSFQIHVFHSKYDGKEHVAMVRGTGFGAAPVDVRVHSECLTGDVMASLRCDCREQLEKGMLELGKQDSGILLYLRQEGRGIGLGNKIKAYALQERGLDTVDANLALGFQDDEREYDTAAAMLRILGATRVNLMTNNPRKIRGLEEHGIEVVQRLPHLIPACAHNQGYLQTKARRSGHLIPV